MTFDREGLIEALGEYVRRLEEGMAAATRAEDRPLYRDRLAQAARMFAVLCGRQPAWDKVREIVTEEERAIGWSYLPGSHGAGAEEAFVTIQSLLRQQ